MKFIESILSISLKKHKYQTAIITTVVHFFKICTRLTQIPLHVSNKVIKCSCNVSVDPCEVNLDLRLRKVSEYFPIFLMHLHQLKGRCERWLIDKHCATLYIWCNGSAGRWARKGQQSGWVVANYKLLSEQSVTFVSRFLRMSHSGLWLVTLVTFQI